VFPPETVAFVEAGSAEIVATVAADGTPRASRGWGITVLDREAGRIRLLLDAAEASTLANVEATGAIAITATDVPTLRSLQMKGMASSIEAATENDLERSAEYTFEFFRDVEATDRIPSDKMRRIVPHALVACTVEVRELFDQTPGPSAGTRVDRDG
jgi:hypothetical protein